MNLQPHLEWFDAQLVAARAVSPDVLLAVSAIEALLLAFFFAAWSRAARRARALGLANAGLDADVAAVSKALEKEIMWRLAGEAPGAKVVKSANSMTAKPPRELQELLAKESFDPTPTIAENGMIQGDLVGGDQII
jgi:hypothetical protein